MDVAGIILVVQTSLISIFMLSWGSYYLYKKVVGKGEER